MRYEVRVAGRTFEIEVEGGRVVIDGQAWEAHLAAVPGTPLVHLLLGEESWTVGAELVDGAAPAGRHWVLGVAGQRFAVEAIDERTRQVEALTAAPPARAHGGIVRAPMPGLVVRIEVTEGQRVEAGAGLVAIEAMKMENELVTPHGGRVARVHVRVGEAVEKGTPLVTVEGAEPSS